MTNKPTDVSGGSAIYGQQTGPDKRQILSDILNELEAEGEIEPRWTTTKSSTDIEDRCKFQHQKTYREKVFNIDNRWFRNKGGREKIKGLVRRELGTKKP